jgi:hypothetical protein
MQVSGNKTSAPVVRYSFNSSIKPPAKGYRVTYLLKEHEEVFSTFKNAFIFLHHQVKAINSPVALIALEAGTWIEGAFILGKKCWLLYDAIDKARKEGLLTDEGELILTT